MTDKTEEQVAKEKASVDAMKNAKANMDAAISRISSLELALMRATESLIRAKANIGSNVYCYPSGGSAKLVHQRIDEEIADLRKEGAVMDELERNYKEAMAQHNETIATSIARRLRDRGVCSTAQNSCRNDYACESGADAIETLQARVEVLEGALRPFALAAEKGSNVYVGVKQAMADCPGLFSYATAYIDAGRSVAHSCLTWNDYRDALDALKEKLT